MSFKGSFFLFLITFKGSTGGDNAIVAGDGVSILVSNSDDDDDDDRGSNNLCLNSKFSFFNLGVFDDAFNDDFVDDFVVDVVVVTDDDDTKCSSLKAEDDGKCSQISDGGSCFI